VSYYDWEGRHLDAVGRGRALEVNEAKTQRGREATIFLSIFRLVMIKISTKFNHQESSPPLKPKKRRTKAEEERETEREKIT